MITQDNLKKHIWYDINEGEFYRIGYYDRWGNYVKTNNKLDKYSKEGYLIISIFGKRYKAHRLVFLYVDNIPVTDEFYVDHINGDRSDNRYSNLRMVDFNTNMKNKGIYSNNSTGVIGISKFGDRFRARINMNGKRISLGLFDTIEEAAKIRKEHEILLNYSENHGSKR